VLLVGFCEKAATYVAFGSTMASQCVTNAITVWHIVFMIFRLSRGTSYDSGTSVFLTADTRIEASVRDGTFLYAACESNMRCTGWLSFSKLRARYSDSNGCIRVCVCVCMYVCTYMCECICTVCVNVYARCTHIPLTSRHACSAPQLFSPSARTHSVLTFSLSTADACSCDAAVNALAEVAFTPRRFVAKLQYLHECK
jgi:hypothetical protein